MNDYLANIYQCTKHLFLHVDRDKFFAEREFMGLSYCQLAFLKLAGTYKNGSIYGYALNKESAKKYINDENYTNANLPFSYYTKKHSLIKNDEEYEYKYSIEDDEYADLLAGLYFPNNEIGDVVSIVYNNKVIGTIEITDKDKIYIPLSDTHFVYCCGLPRIYFKCNNNVEFHAVSIVLPATTIMTKLALWTCVYQLKNKTLYYSYCTRYSGKPCNGCDHGEPEIANYPQIASARVIQKAWKNYKRRCLDQWKDNIGDVNEEIEYMPNLGIEYFNALNDYNINITI